MPRPAVALAARPARRAPVAQHHNQHDEDAQQDARPGQHADQGLFAGVRLHGGAERVLLHHAAHGGQGKRLRFGGGGLREGSGIAGGGEGGGGRGGGRFPPAPAA
ncbi:MAG TPA: hypothetical protein DD737_04570 [Ruminococcaceae bacterium]|nr:hypothetical protein [Oscillospiraceae bacterium]